MDYEGDYEHPKLLPGFAYFAILVMAIIGVIYFDWILPSNKEKIFVDIAKSHICPEAIKTGFTNERHEFFCVDYEGNIEIIGYSVRNLNFIPVEHVKTYSYCWLQGGTYEIVKGDLYDCSLQPDSTKKYIKNIGSVKDPFLPGVDR